MQRDLEVPKDARVRVDRPEQERQHQTRTQCAAVPLKSAPFTYSASHNSLNRLKASKALPKRLPAAIMPSSFPMRCWILIIPKRSARRVLMKRLTLLAVAML